MSNALIARFNGQPLAQPKEHGALMAPEKHLMTLVEKIKPVIAAERIRESSGSFWRRPKLFTDPQSAENMFQEFALTQTKLQADAAALANMLRLAQEATYRFSVSRPEDRRIGEQWRRESSAQLQARWPITLPATQYEPLELYRHKAQPAKIAEGMNQLLHQQVGHLVQAVFVTASQLVQAEVLGGTVFVGEDAARYWTFRYELSLSRDAVNRNAVTTLRTDNGKTFEDTATTTDYDARFITKHFIFNHALINTRRMPARDATLPPPAQAIVDAAPEGWKDLLTVLDGQEVMREVAERVVDDRTFQQREQTFTTRELPAPAPLRREVVYTPDPALILADTFVLCEW